MKIVGIVGSVAEVSYNRLLLEYIKKHFNYLFELDIVEIDNISVFNQSDDQTNSPAVQSINKKITNADAVIIATPEHNHTIPAGLKSIIEWLSFKINPLENKPVMVVGASYYDQGSSRAQLHLRQILDSPGVNSIVMPGNEFLLGVVKEAFDENNNLIDKQTIEFLGEVLEKFKQFIQLVTRIEEAEEVPLEPEDLHATGKVDTTIEGIEKTAEDWVEQAAEAVGAVDGDTYVRLNRGILTVDQLNHFLASMPMELTFADGNNQFLYYNKVASKEDMLAGRVPGQVGHPLFDCHPEAALKNVEWVIQQLRAGKQDAVRVHVPTHGPDKYVVHNYQAMHDEKGNYTGINEYVLDLKPVIDWYLEQTGQELVGGVDGVSGASAKDEKEEVDAVSGATAQ